MIACGVWGCLNDISSRVCRNCGSNYSIVVIDDGD